VGSPLKQLSRVRLRDFTRLAYTTSRALLLRNNDHRDGDDRIGLEGDDGGDDDDDDDDVVLEATGYGGYDGRLTVMYRVYVVL